MHRPRLDNWRSLCKFFNRADIPYTDDEIGRIIHYEKAATVDFINRLYTLLTQAIQREQVRLQLADQWGEFQSAPSQEI